MNAAYKQEKKKNAKRKTHNVPSLTFKVADPLFDAGDSPSPKRLKESLYLSFPVETVLATEQSGSEDIKTELAYHLSESDVHWGGRCEDITCCQELLQVLGGSDENPDVAEMSWRISPVKTESGTRHDRNTDPHVLSGFPDKKKSSFPWKCC